MTMSGVGARPREGRSWPFGSELTVLADLAPWRWNLLGRRLTPLTIAAITAHFEKLGYTVERKPVHDIELFFNGLGHGLFCVVPSQNIPSRALLPLMVRRAEALNATLVLICGEKCPKELHDEALVRGMILIEWRSIRTFGKKLKILRGFGRHELSYAKRDSRAELPRPTDTLLIPLNDRQKAAGYLFRTEEISCFFVDRGGSTLLVTFAPWGSNPESAARNGEVYGAVAGLSTLGFETVAPNWYPHHHMLECLERVAPRIDERFPVRVLLGASQGGFAAIKYSKALRAETVLAFSPPYSVDPAITNDRRFVAYYKPPLQSGMHIRANETAGSLYLVFDPADAADLDHAQTLHRELVGVAMIPAWFAGHGVHRISHDPAVTVALLRHAEAGSTEVLRQVCGTGRHGDKGRAFRMALYLADRKPRIAHRIFLRYHLERPEQDWWKVCYRLSTAGLAAETIDWLVAAAKEKPDHADLHACTAIAAEQAGQLDVAFDAVARALKLEPSSLKFQHIQERVLNKRQSFTRH